MKPALHPDDLPPSVASALRYGHEFGRSSTLGTVPSGHPALDAQLPGSGWPCGVLTELLQPQSCIFEWRVIGPCLRTLGAKGGTVVMVSPPQPPHLPGLRKHGLDQRQLVWVDSRTTAQRLWVIEQVIKANPAGAVVAWLPQARPEQLRRLQVCAQRCEGPVFLFRPLAARHESSAAPLRLSLALGADNAIEVQVLKRRGPAHEGVVTITDLPASLRRVLAHRLGRGDETPEHHHEESPHAVLAGAHAAP